MSEVSDRQVAQTPIADAPADRDPDRRLLFLGIDGGGTKTHVVITDEAFNVAGEGFSGGSNPLRSGLEEAVAHIEDAVADACAAAGASLRDISAACAAIAGVNHPIHHHTMKEALDLALGLKELELVNDAQAALQGALDGKPGVAIIAGTGSIALGISESGGHARSGGFSVRAVRSARSRLPIRSSSASSAR